MAVAEGVEAERVELPTSTLVTHLGISLETLRSKPETLVVSRDGDQWSRPEPGAILGNSEKNAVSNTSVEHFTEVF